MDLTINEDKLRLISQEELCVEEYLYLWSRFWGNGWMGWYHSNIDMAHLSSKGLLTSSGITAEARKLIDRVENHCTNSDVEFEDFWNLFPDEDGDEVFPSTRQLKLGKDKVKSMFVAKSRQYTPQAIIDSLQQELEWKKQAALSKKPLDSP